jgi:hypothetical protein
MLVQLDDLPIVWSQEYHAVRYAIDAARLRAEGVVQVTEVESRDTVTGTALLLVCRLATVALDGPRDRRGALAHYAERRFDFESISTAGAWHSTRVASRA